MTSATEAASVFGLLARQVAAYAGHDLFLVPETVREFWRLQATRWSYRDTLDNAESLAAVYRDRGYGKGHRIALVLENRPVFFFHWLALNSLGASVVPINPDYTKDELAYVLGHSECVLAVTLDAHLAKVREAAADLPISVVTDADPAPPKPAVAAAGPADAVAKAECALVYTSGTTGRPKGCLLSNAYFLGWSDWYSAQGGLISLRDGSERLITPLPAFHVNAIGNSFMGMLGKGGAQVIVDRFHPRSWWQSAVETRATCLHYLGVMPAILLAAPESGLDRAHSIRFGLGGGVHPDHHANFERRFGIPLLEGWAMTETGGGGLLCSAEEPRHVGERCVGRPNRPGPPMEVRLVDDEGRDQPSGIAGELLVRAAGPDRRHRFFTAYLKDEAATNAAWAGDWLHTGDIMRQGEDGSLYFVDRKKNIIRRSGENIAAMEVETAIVAHPAVANVAAVAVPDAFREEEVMAVVVASDGAQRDAELAQAIFEHCAAKLAYFKLPGYIAFLDKLPTTSTQKVRKADLGDLAMNPMAFEHCYDFREAKQRRRPARS